MDTPTTLIPNEEVGKVLIPNEMATALMSRGWVRSWEESSRSGRRWYFWLTADKKVVFESEIVEEDWRG